MADLVVSSIAPSELRRQLIYSVAIGEMPRITKIQLLWPVSGPKPALMKVSEATIAPDVPRDHCTGARGLSETSQETDFMAQFTNEDGETILEGEVIAVQDEVATVLSTNDVNVEVSLRDIVTGLFWQ